MSQWNIVCAGSPRIGAGVGHVHFMLFVSFSFALGSQCEPSFRWNMGFKSMGGQWGGLHLVCEGLRGVCEAFYIPTCWYLQHKMVAFGVETNVTAQREWFRVAVEYRLKDRQGVSAHIKLRSQTLNNPKAPDPLGD